MLAYVLDEIVEEGLANAEEIRTGAIDAAKIRLLGSGQNEVLYPGLEIRDLWRVGSWRGDGIHRRAPPLGLHVRRPRRGAYAISGATDVPGTTALILAVVAFGAMLILLIVKPPEALPCLVAFGSTVAIVIIGIVNLQDINALEPFSNPHATDSDGYYSTGNGVRLVLVGGIVSCVGSFAFPLLGLWHHYRKS